MKTTKLILAIVTFTIIVSCGQSDEQKAATIKVQAQAQATAASNAAQLKTLQDEHDRIAAKAQAAAVVAKAQANAEAQAAQEQQASDNAELLIQDKAALAAAESKMKDIESFTFGRTKDEKERQIQEQAEIIERLKVEIGKLERQ